MPRYPNSTPWPGDAGHAPPAFPFPEAAYQRFLSGARLTDSRTIRAAYGAGWKTRGDET